MIDMNICVFCSAEDIDEKYTKPAQEFARLIGANGHTFIWGGSDRGLMQLMASAAQNAGGRIVGISMEMLKDRARKNADEMIIAKDLGERKAMMLARADVLVAMVGGIGTLDEVMGVLELKKHRVHEKPVIIFNIANFFDGFRQQFEKMEHEHFLPRPLNELMYFADTPDDAMRYIESHGN